jgi:hypothetical protein
MKPSSFRLSPRGALMAIVSAAFANHAFAATAGRVDFVFGDAALRGASGQERPLARGAEIMDGDTLITRNGRAQIRFTDGGFVSLQPNTEFGVREYRYEGKTDGSERGFFALVRGAMRTVTGAIGRFNRSAYQVRTPTATVGIRGTGGLIEVLPDLATLIRGSSGTWILTNPAGQIDVPAGTAGIAPPDPKAPPKPTDLQPYLPPAPVLDAIFRQSEETTADGKACVITGFCESQTVPLVSGPGFHVSFAFGGTTAGASIGSSSGSADATFNALGQLTGWANAQRVTTTFSGTHLEGGTAAGVVGWGRWIGPTTLTTGAIPTFGPTEGFHYVVGLPTATMMPTTGVLPFTLIGATSPTGSDGLLIPGTLGIGSLTLDFINKVVTMSLSPRFLTWGYDASFSANVSAGLPQFGGNGNAVDFGLPPSNYACGGSGCSTSFNGAFFGAGASHAGTPYNIVSPGGTTVSGVAVFQQ